MGQSNVRKKVEQEMAIITNLVRDNEEIFLVCGLNQNKNLVLSDVGTKIDLLHRLLGLDSFSRLIGHYFETNKMSLNKPYLLKMKLTRGELDIKYFESLIEILPIMREGA